MHAMVQCWAEKYLLLRLRKCQSLNVSSIAIVFQRGHYSYSVANSGSIQMSAAFKLRQRSNFGIEEPTFVPPHYSYRVQMLTLLPMIKWRHYCAAV